MLLTRKTGIPLFIVALIALCALELAVTTSPLFPQNLSVLALVITADLLLGIPLLFYGLVARPYRLSPISVAPIFLLAILIAWYILPPGGRGYLGAVAMLAPLIEVACLLVVVWKIHGIYHGYRQARREQPYAIDALETSVRSAFGNHLAINIIVIEFSLIFLAFFGWFRKFRPLNPQDTVFTYHRKSLYPALMLVFLFLTVIETVALHLLIQHWSPLAAWILTGLSIYTLLWLIGDFGAVRLHPIVVSAETLFLRTGFRWSATLRLSDIVALQTPKMSDAKSRDYLSMALVGEPNIVLVLKQPVRAHGLFGRTKNVLRIGLFLDDKDAFRAELGL